MKLVRLIRPTVAMSLIVLGLATPAYAGAGLPGVGVPEIDPGSVMGALAVLSGGLLMITDRLARK